MQYQKYHKLCYNLYTIPKASLFVLQCIASSDVLQYSTVQQLFFHPLNGHIIAFRPGIGKALCFALHAPPHTAADFIILTMNDDDNPFHSDFGDDDEKEDDADAKNAKVSRSTGFGTCCDQRQRSHRGKVTITQSGDHKTQAV